MREDESYDVDFENLEELLKKRKTTMFLLCSPHNPTGKALLEKG